MNDNTTRSRIVAAADQLFYQRGFEHTSFAHIADAVQISRGNFYHHFKSKDDILAAVIELRLNNTRKLLDQWEAEGELPAERIRCFIKILITNWAKIKYYGCPVGTLTTELAKLQHPAQQQAAKIFSMFRTWLRKQFNQLGCKKNADNLALHVLAFSQGVATVASAFGNEKFVKQQVQQMCEWLDTIAPSRTS